MLRARATRLRASFSARTSISSARGPRWRCWRARGRWRARRRRGRRGGRTRRERWRGRRAWRGLRDRPAQELLVQLGQLARDDDVLRGAEDGFDVGERGQNAVRGFVENLEPGGIIPKSQNRDVTPQRAKTARRGPVWSTRLVSPSGTRFFKLRGRCGAGLLLREGSRGR